MKKKWNIFNPVPYAEEIRKIQEMVRVDRVIASLLFQRSLVNYEDIKDFFCYSDKLIHSPEWMHDMEKAGERIYRAVNSNEKILIYGDYDVDGTTAVTLVYSFIRKFYPSVGYYLPDRYNEGYGISFQGIDYAVEHGYSLIITMDCGITSLDKIAYAKSKGIDVIVCDHHLPPPSLPEAYAILNPKKKNCSYPFKELTGCGIGFKLVQYLNKLFKLDADVYDYLDLVALSIGADLVPITGENRVLAYKGLEKINKAPRPAIKAFNYLLNIEDKYDINRIVFSIGPRINSAGRICHGKHAVQLLMVEDEEEALMLAQEIDKFNEQRKTLDSQVTHHAIAQIEKNLIGNRKTIVVAGENWHKGVIGIVASRIIEKHYRPTIVFCKQDSYWVGSGRSIEGFDLYEALHHCRNHIVQFGGHRYAAGLMVSEEKLNLFTEDFENYASRALPDEALIPSMDISAELPLHQISENFIQVLSRFAPFGPGNLNPTFCAYNVLDVGWCKIVGQNTLKMELYQKENPGRRFQALGFGLGDYFPIVNRKQPVHIAYKIVHKNTNNKHFVHLQIEDIRTD